MTRQSFLALAGAHWAGLPGWVETLAIEADRTSATAVAGRIGYSTSAVSNVIRNTYKGRIDKVEAAVRGALLGETVVCPVLGEMSRDICIEEQRKPNLQTSAARTKIFAACRGGCPHSRIAPKTDGGAA